MAEAELLALEKGDFSGFAEGERLALEFAEELTANSNRIGDELFRQLRSKFEEGEIVEIAVVAGIFNYFNRVNNALQMEPAR